MLYTSFQEVRYHADGRTRTSLSVVSKVRRHLVPPGESDFYDDLPLLIRAVPPSLKFCHIMDLEYILEVSSLRKKLQRMQCYIHPCIIPLVWKSERL